MYVIEAGVTAIIRDFLLRNKINRQPVYFKVHFLFFQGSRSGLTSILIRIEHFSSIRIHKVIESGSNTFRIRIRNRTFWGQFFFNVSKLKAMVKYTRSFLVFLTFQFSNMKNYEKVQFSLQFLPLDPDLDSNFGSGSTNSLKRIQSEYGSTTLPFSLSTLLCCGSE
jgi:hypothetical protein